MEEVIQLNMTLQESDFLTELLINSLYGMNSDVRETVSAKLEYARTRYIVDAQDFG